MERGILALATPTLAGWCWVGWGWKKWKLDLYRQGESGDIYLSCEQNSASCRESPKGSYTHGFFLFGFGSPNRDTSISGLTLVKKVPCGGPK
jgi:hypothetical protein